MSRVNANLLLTLVALIWGSAFVAQSRGMAHLGPMLFTGVRFLIGALVVTPPSCCRLKPCLLPALATC